MANYKAVIYDIDGTLLDTLKMNIIPLLKILHEEGLTDLNYASILKYAAYPGRKVMDELKIKNPDDVYLRWIQYVNAYGEGATIYPGIVELLKEVELLGIRQAIVSAKTMNQYRIDFLAKGLDSFMECCILAEDTFKHKPDPEPLLMCLNRLNLNNNEVCYVGDSYSDYLASSASGIDFIYAKWNGLVDERIHAKIELNHPLELIEVLI